MSPSRPEVGDPGPVDQRFQSVEEPRERSIDGVRSRTAVGTVVRFRGHLGALSNLADRIGPRTSSWEHRERVLEVSGETGDRYRGHYGQQGFPGVPGYEYAEIREAWEPRNS